MSSDSDSDGIDVANNFKKGMDKFCYKPVEAASGPQNPTNGSDNEEPVVSNEVEMNTQNEEDALDNSQIPKRTRGRKARSNISNTSSSVSSENAPASNNNSASILDQILSKNRATSSPQNSVSGKRKARKSRNEDNDLLQNAPSPKKVVHRIEVPQIGNLEYKLKVLSQRCQEIMDMGETTGRKSKRKPNKPSTRNSKKFEEIHELSTDEEENKTEENINPIVQVNFLWRSIHRKSFKVLKFDKLESIVDYLTKKYEVNPKLLLFTIDEKEIDLKNNTYASLGLNENVLIEGGVLPDSYLEKDSLPKNDDRGKGIKFKVQLNSRNNFDVFLPPFVKMEVLYSQVSLEAKMRIDKFKILHDGQRVKFNDTFSTLGLEEGDVFDVVPLP